jgi:PD-(D/E)XK nuclease superfamily
VCPTGNVSRPYENFLAHWQGRGERNVKSPEILVANRWHEEVEGVVAHVCRALTGDAKDVLVVGPENSATGRALVHELVSRGIAAADEFREMTLPSPLIQIQIGIARYLAEEEAPELFLRIVQGLLRSPKRFKEFREALFRTFDGLQTRSVNRLITDRLRERFAWVVDLESAFEAWPQKDNWRTLQQRWELLVERLASICAKYPGEFIQLTWSIVELEPLWHEVGVFLEGRTLSVRLFLKYLCELLSAQARRPHPDSHHRYAKVVVAPPSKAHATSWDYVILTDAISDGWTPAPAANSVLTDEERMRFRRDGYFLAVASEKRQIRQERILQLAYHARTHLVLARYERDEKGIETGANDLGTFAEEFLKAKVTRIHALPKTDTRIPIFATVWSNRLNPEQPFDEYFLNFRGAGLAKAPWHPSALETVFKTPATFAFKTVYGCQREFDRAFFRSAQMTVGRIAHRWLQSAFGKNARFASFRQSPLRIPERASALFRSELEIAYMRTRSETPVPDLWWETILNKAFSLALRMLERAGSYFDPYAYYQSESELKGIWHSTGGDLALDGRTDLILSDLAQLKDASVQIVDFKTSKRVRTFDHENGDGLQFLGYQLLAKINGARSVELMIVTPDQSKQIQLPTDADLTSLINLLARLQSSQSFGCRPSVKWDVAETLPIATVPIAPDVLERKLALTWK